MTTKPTHAYLIASDLTDAVLEGTHLDESFRGHKRFRANHENHLHKAVRLTLEDTTVKHFPRMYDFLVLGKKPSTAYIATIVEPVWNDARLTAYAPDAVHRTVAEHPDLLQHILPFEDVSNAIQGYFIVNEAFRKINYNAESVVVAHRSDFDRVHKLITSNEFVRKKGVTLHSILHEKYPAPHKKIIL